MMHEADMFKNITLKTDAVNPILIQSVVVIINWSPIFGNILHITSLS